MPWQGVEEWVNVLREDLLHAKLQVSRVGRRFHHVFGFKMNEHE